MITTTRCIAASLTLHGSLLAFAAYGSVVLPFAPQGVSRHALEGTISVDAAGPEASAGPAAASAEGPERGGAAEKPVPLPARPAAVHVAKAAPRREVAPAPRAVEPLLPVPEPVPPAPAAAFAGPAGGATAAPSAVAPRPGHELVPVPGGTLGASGTAALGFGAQGAGAGVGADDGRAGSGRSGNDEHGPLLAHYLKGVRERVARHREYPYIARRANLEGTVCLRVSIGASGNVRSVTATCGKTKQPLLGAALESVSRAAPFPPLPAALGKELTLDVPIVFDLDDL